MMCLQAKDVSRTQRVQLQCQCCGLLHGLSGYNGSVGFDQFISYGKHCQQSVIICEMVISVVTEVKIEISTTGFVADHNSYFMR